MSELQRTQPTGSHELLSTKFALPRLRAPLVVRERLLARLDQGLEQKLTLLSAPAGFGKTTLVADWVRRGGSWEVAWLLLDGGDNDPVRFWRYFITACRTFDAALGKPALAALRAAQPPSFEKVLIPFINELAQLPGQCILVLEDYHVITSPPVHETVTFLVDHLPPTLHLVLMTRSEPRLPTARLRARNELCEINSLDLRFSGEETQAFLQQALPVPPAPEVTVRIQERTEGWVTGLRLLALALRGQEEPGQVEEYLATFSGEHRHVMEYLAGEVLAALPESLQTFLLETSFLNRLSGSLCDAVLGVDDQRPPGAESRPPSQAILEHLERANLFLVPLDPAGEWYRYHGLFADAMRHYACQRLGQDHVRALHERASLWFETHGLLDEAVEAALAAGQFSHAATLIEHLLQTRGLSEAHTFPRWVEQLPEEVLVAHPLLCFNHAMALLFSSDRFTPATGALIETPLRRAEEAWRLEKNDPGLGQVFALRSVAALWQDDLARSFDYAHQALELLAEHDVLWRDVSLMNVGREA